VIVDVNLDGLLEWLQLFERKLGQNLKVQFRFKSLLLQRINPILRTWKSSWKVLELTPHLQPHQNLPAWNDIKLHFTRSEIR
jgi:hypothetical protein